MKLIKNYIYNLFYQIIAIVIPFLLLPYLSKTIGVEANGIYSYTKTIADYFILFAMLGLKNYGVREIAQVKNEKDKLSKVFWELYFMQLINSLLIIGIYIILNIFILKTYTTIFWLQLIYIFSTIFDITWFYSGIENFKNVSIKNTIIKLLSLLCVFKFVHTPEDLWKYTLINAICYIIGNLIFWYKINKYVTIQIPKIAARKRHVFPNII